MNLKKPTYSERVLDDFARKEWDKAKAYLKKQIPALSEAECEDIFQDSFIILFQNNRDGKLKDVKSSLSTYFLSICRNKAFELCRSKNRGIYFDSDFGLETLDEVNEEKLDTLLALDTDVSLTESKKAIARQIVKDLPQPCDELLWGFYRDNLSLKTLADMLNKTVGYVKVTKHRCQEKFRKRWGELVKNLL